MKLLTVLACCFFFSASFAQVPKAPNDEIIYHVFERSFYDSNGDSHGDLNGIRLKLDYIRQLGATAILLTPLYRSVYYHNYFAGDFKQIDPAYGTMADFVKLAKEIHRRGMKVYLDMETQYVTEDHLWWKDSFNNPSSPYSDYILYQDKAQQHPETIVYNLTELKGYNGVTRKITTVNLNSPKVKEYNYQLFKYWMDPNNDGKFDDGADGFRLDHMMDNLDNKPMLANLFASFWVPLLTRLRAVNPAIKIVAEQANWASFGSDYLTKGGVDCVFGFRLAFAIRNFNKKEIMAVADSTLNHNPPGKQQVVFIENHDMPRFANAVKQDVMKEKTGAALNLLIGGVPAIYYGQEIGMDGKSANYGMTDANEIQDREAFEWYKSDTGKGMAFWYKDSGPWWNNSFDKPDDGISLEEEKNDPNSLWNYYRSLTALRKKYPALINGSYAGLTNENDKVVSFSRQTAGQYVVIVINLSATAQNATITLPVNDQSALKVFGAGNGRLKDGLLTVSLPAGAAQVFELKP